MKPTDAFAYTGPMPRPPFYKHLYVKVLAAIFIGVVLGVLSPSDVKNVPAWQQPFLLLPPGWGEAMKPFGDGFIKLIKMLIAPIIFCTVVHGIASMKNMRKVGSVGLKSLIYFEVVTTAALAIGVIISNVWRPGSGMNVDLASLNTSAVASYVAKAKEHGAVEYFLNIIPNTVVGAFSEGEILQVLFLAILFGFALFALGDRGRPLVALIDVTAHAFFGIVGIVMKLAPLGAFGAMAFTIGKYGLGTLLSLGKLMLCFYATCLIFIFVVLGTIAALTGFNIFKFIRYIKEELLIVLGTSSSESVLPRMIAKMKVLGCEESVVGLVIPAGLFVQPRRHLHLPHHGGAVPGAGDEHRPDALAATRHPGHPAAHFEGRGRRDRLGLRGAGRDAVLGGHHPGGLHRADPGRGPLHVGSARAHQPDRQRRGDDCGLEDGGRAGHGGDAAAALRRGNGPGGGA